MEYPGTGIRYYLGTSRDADLIISAAFSGDQIALDRARTEYNLGFRIILPFGSLATQYEGCIYWPQGG